MAKDLFSVPIFFILFRETLEASIIVSVLLSLVEQLVVKTSFGSVLANSAADTSALDHAEGSEHKTASSGSDDVVELTSDEQSRKLIRAMRIQIFAGAGIGLFIAVAIGAAFIAVFYTTLSDLWEKSEELWEGIFSLVACILIFVMGITMLRMDRAKIKWRLKLQAAFDKKALKEGQKSSKMEKYALFFLPLITVLREGLEAVVFVGGVALGQDATSIPIAAIVGIFAGLACGWLIYKSSSRLNLSIFLIVSTDFLLLIGAGLFSKAVGDFERYEFNRHVGGDVAESGNGPGSYPIPGNVWHLNCCNPEDKTSTGWSIFNAVLGWTNNGTVGTILSYVFYWLAVIACLVYMKWSEGRCTLFGYKSAAYVRREQNRREKNMEPLMTPPEEDGSKQLH